MAEHILTLNSGSSSLKFAVFRRAETPVETLRGDISGIGGKPHLRLNEAGGKVLRSEQLSAAAVPDLAAALHLTLEAIDDLVADSDIAAVGHRVVHGGLAYDQPVLVDDGVLARLDGLTQLARLHQPFNIAGIRTAQREFPSALQVACFDTSFHRSHPWVDDTFALPRKFYDEGVRRYGFHGLSYEYITSELARIAPHHAAGRLVAAHLGNGSSICAIRGGQSIGSSMGFTAIDGLPMGTRCGQIDPGVVLYLQRQHGMSVDEVEVLLSMQSGLLGLSGISNDMRTLEQAATPEALAAIDYYVFRVRRELGAMTAILNGLDAIVFCGGIGENSAETRRNICAGFEWIGLELDVSRNRRTECIISSDRSRVRVFVIPTNEEAMIAKHTQNLLNA